MMTTTHVFSPLQKGAAVSQALSSRVAMAAAPRTARVARVSARSRRSLKVSAVATTPVVGGYEQPELGYSGMQGKAMASAMKTDWPTKREILGVIPEHCFVKDTWLSLQYAAISTALTVTAGLAAYTYIPMTLAWAPAWVAYALWTGTVATGCWVAAHECGHGAFSDNKFIQDAVGYVLHTALLVPYFSWQRSHAVHHSRTNHAEEGETHVPSLAENEGPIFGMKKVLGEGPFAIVHAAIVLLFGWPMYLLTGASGGPVRGKTNHFWPWAGADGKHALFPGQIYKDKVLWSDVGIVGFLGALAYWAYSAGSVVPVALVYGMPYLVTNAWLVLYTWLQHTDVDVPHFAGQKEKVDANGNPLPLAHHEWSWEKGAFMTIDRPYGKFFDFVHHRIGSTHVAHHLNHQIPHYHALEATNAIKNAFPELYLYDPTPIWEATMRVAGKCIGVKKNSDNLYVFASSPN